MQTGQARIKKPTNTALPSEIRFGEWERDMGLSKEYSKKEEEEEFKSGTER